MTRAQGREFKADLLDLVEEQATQPVPDIEAVRVMVEGLFSKLEAEIGKETSRTSPR
jgi:hypothetical protein